MTEIIKIIFIGLIAHMDLANSNTAVMLKADKHVPEMRIFRGDGSSKTVNVSQKRITISPGIGNSHPKHTKIIGNVPEIGDITGGKCGGPRQPIVDRKPDSTVEAYIDYEGGELEPLAFNDELLHFAHGKRWATCRCAACGTSLDLEVNEGAAITIVIADIVKPGDASKQETYTVTANDLVVFRDAPPKGTTVMGDHFPLYYGLLKNCPANDVVLMDCKDAQGNPHPHCKELARCTTVDPLPQAARTASSTSRRARRPKGGQLTFNLNEFLEYIITPTIECTNGQYP
jgi:hypothetical protein